MLIEIVDLCAGHLDIEEDTVKQHILQQRLIAFEDIEHLLLPAIKYTKAPLTVGEVKYRIKKYKLTEENAVAIVERVLASLPPRFNAEI
jgi:hypothetical protein